ncbi:MAG: LysR family transcriptional regulator [Bacteroidales bacterium]|nr:LysR family transcriptional regulator [Bacteroidales bacterium]
MAKNLLPEHIRFNYKIWLSNDKDEGILGDGKRQILKAIEEHGSLKGATVALGITYRRTWGDLKKIEEMLGFTILDKERGGKEGGKMSLTPEGRKLIQAFDAFHEKVDDVIEKAFDEFRSQLTR